jgi:hypothetical protein
MAFKARIQAEIAAVGRGGALRCVGENQWVGDGEPTFHFVNLAPQSGVGGVYYDSLGVNNYTVSFLCKQRGVALDAIERETKCHLRIPNKSFPQKDPREISFSGIRRAIERAKVLITEKISESLWCCTRLQLVCHLEACVEDILEGLYTGDGGAWFLLPVKAPWTHGN